jgi:hypothetical protein
MKAFTIIRVSGEDQLRGYGPDSQWADDVVPNAPLLGLEVSEGLRRVIQEPATTWDREKFGTAVKEALESFHQDVVQAIIFPRVDHETRFIFGSFPILCEVIRAGMRVYFGRERFELNPNDNESVSRYLRKAEEAQAYVETMRLNTMRGRRRRAERNHMMPTARSKFAHDYHPYRRDWSKIPDATSGRYTVNAEKASLVRQWTDWILDNGYSTNRCCRLTKERYGIQLCRSTIVEALSDPAMIGKFYAYRTMDVRSPTKSKRKTIKKDEKDWLLVYEDPAQAILSADQFYALKEKFERNRANSPRSTKHWYPPLRSIIFCACGRRMVATTFGQKEHRQPRYRCIQCKRYVKAVPLWEDIKAGVRQRLLQPERLVPAIKAQLDSGESIARLEEELKSNRQRLDVLRQAEQKALRLHLYLPDYPVERLDEEVHRIGEQRRQLEGDGHKLENQLSELRQAVVDDEGLRRFCEKTARNLDALDDGQWRVLLETIKVKILVNDEGITVKMALPAIKEENAVTVEPTWASHNRHSGSSP